MNRGFKLFIAYKRLGTLLAILAAFLTMKIMQVHVAAQQPTSVTPKERVLDDAIPKSVPIKIKLKKGTEESFKDLTNLKWVREFELELTNTGDRPIYFLYLELISDSDTNGPKLQVDALVYGRNELGDIISKPWPEDSPIKPGETYVFKIHSAQASSWEDGVRKERHQDAARVQVLFQTLSFGDGTGLWDAQGSPYPAARKQ